MLRGTAEEEGEMYFPFASAPILYVTPRNAAGHGRGGGVIPAAETKLGIDLFPYIVSQRRGRD